MAGLGEHMSQTHAAFRESDMSVVKEERYVFKVDWFDKQADLIRQYLLTFYPGDASAEMVSYTIHFFHVHMHSCLKFNLATYLSFVFAFPIV